MRMRIRLPHFTNIWDNLQHVPQKLFWDFLQKRDHVNVRSGNVRGLGAKQPAQLTAALRTSKS